MKTIATAEIDLGSPEDESDAAVTSVSPGAAASGRTRVILVAEDHFVNQQLFKTILEKRGYQTVLASNGREAVTEAQTRSPDLIFMDVQMPEMNGYEATSQIRQLGISTPIIAVTASALKGESEKCLAVGMNDFLPKPFKARDVFPVLDRWIDSADFEQEGEEIAELEAVDGEEESAAIFDFESAVESFMNKPEVVTRVVQGFIDRTGERFAAMQEALERGDLKTVGSEAHAIKGGAWNLSAIALGNAAAAVERGAHAAAIGAEEAAAADQAGTPLETLYQDLVHEFNRFAEHCRHHPELH